MQTDEKYKRDASTIMFAIYFPSSSLSEYRNGHHETERVTKGRHFICSDLRFSTLFKMANSFGTTGAEFIAVSQFFDTHNRVWHWQVIFGVIYEGKKMYILY